MSRSVSFLEVKQQELLVSNRILDKKIRLSAKALSQLYLTLSTIKSENSPEQQFPYHRSAQFCEEVLAGISAWQTAGCELLIFSGMGENIAPQVAYSALRIIGALVGDLLVETSLEPQAQKSNLLVPQRPLIRRYSGEVGNEGVGSLGPTPDYLAVFYLRGLNQGGAFKFVRGADIHQLLAESFPEDHQQLFQPFFFSVPYGYSNEVVTTAKPIFFDNCGAVGVNYLRSSIERGHSQLRGCEFTRRQLQALDRFDEFLYSPSLTTTINLSPGDMVFVKNTDYLIGFPKVSRFNSGTAESLQKILISKRSGSASVEGVLGRC